MFQWIIGSIAIILTVILLLKGINLGIIMLIDSIALALATQMGVKNAFNAMIVGIVSVNTVSIILVLIMILMLEHTMQETGMIKTMVSSLQGVFRKKKTVAMMLPCFIGLLPSPGGARFSCAMVEETLGDTAQAEDKAFINYWYRHAWLDAFILYPAMIMASELLNTSSIKLFGMMLFFMVINWIAGLIVLGKNITQVTENKSVGNRNKAMINLFKSLAPVISIIVGYLLLMHTIQQALFVSCLGSITVLMLIKKYKWKQVIKTIKYGFNWKYVILIAGVMMFTSVLNESGMMTTLSEAITKHNIPVRVLYVVLPLMVSLISGLSVNAIAVAYPILIPLGLAESSMLVISATYASAVVGLMLSPVHLCSVFSAEYFNVPLHRLLKRTGYGQIFLLISITIIMIFG